MTDVGGIHPRWVVPPLSSWSWVIKESRLSKPWKANGSAELLPALLQFPPRWLLVTVSTAATESTPEECARPVSSATALVHLYTSPTVTLAGRTQVSISN